MRFLGLDDSLANDELIRWQRGDVFFGLDMQHHVQISHADFYHQLISEGVVVKFLIHDLLPVQLPDLFSDPNAKDLHEQWLTLIATTDGAVCVSKATADALDDWLSKNAIPRAPTFSTDWVHSGADLEGSKPSVGLPDSADSVLQSLRQRPTFLCVSTLEPRKCQQQILEAVELLWKYGSDINLVFVGREGWKTGALITRIRTHNEAGTRLFWLQSVSDEYLQKIYTACSCLISASLNEGFGLPLIEAALHGIPIIARDISVFREVAGEHAEYFVGESAEELAKALETWLERYREGTHTTSTGMRYSLWKESSERLKRTLLSSNCPRRQLLVDVSELVQHDAGTGIQRVVRNILKEWLVNPPDGYRVEPVYATLEEEYRYARQFTQTLFASERRALVDEPIDYAPGDIFFGLDLQPQVQLAQRTFYQLLRREGVQVKFLVHDLLCITMPEFFLPGSREGFQHWLEVITENDAAVCVSQSTAQELEHWIKQNNPSHLNRFNISCSHNGADLEYSHSNTRLSPDMQETLAQLQLYPTFLMVGTLEPRKGHMDALDAFEMLWESGVDVTLAIVGKQGWMVDELVNRLRSHPKLNRSLFWLEGIDDGYLARVYAKSTCLIAAAYGEGFGLPLIEAAQYNLPIIARDIPIFREIAGESAYYFDSSSPLDLSNVIKNWMILYTRKQHPPSDQIPWLKWHESAENLKKVLIP